MIDWQEVELRELIAVNPRLKLSKNAIARKIGMEHLEPYQKWPVGSELTPFKGGSKFQNDDVLLARITPCLENGKTAAVRGLNQSEVAFGSTEFLVLRSNGPIDQLFLFYLAIEPSFREFAIQTMTGSSGRQRVQTEALLDFELNLPPLEEQEAIAEVLSSLDDKIDLLKRQNKTLEGMAEALFRQWFIEEAQDDWEQVPLDDLFEVNPKESITKSLPAPFVEMKNLQEFRSTIGDWRFREFTSGSKFRNGDTLFARITPCLENGKIGLVRSLPTNVVGWGSTEFIVLRPRLGISPLLGFALGINPEFRELAISSMTGSSGRQRARTEVLHNFTLFMPPAPILDEINATIDALESRISKNQAEIKNVTAQRDTLLPKLMSGEVRVQNTRIDE